MSAYLSDARRFDMGERRPFHIDGDGLDRDGNDGRMGAHRPSRNVFLDADGKGSREGFAGGIGGQRGRNVRFSRTAYPEPQASRNLGFKKWECRPASSRDWRAKASTSAARLGRMAASRPTFSTTRPMPNRFVAALAKRLRG